MTTTAKHRGEPTAIEQALVPTAADFEKHARNGIFPDYIVSYHAGVNRSTLAEMDSDDNVHVTELGWDDLSISARRLLERARIDAVIMGSVGATFIHDRASTKDAYITVGRWTR